MNYLTINFRNEAIMLLILVVAFSSCGDEEDTNEQQAEATSETITISENSIPVLRKQDLGLQKVAIKEVTKYVSITGRVIPKNTTQLIAEVQGRHLTGSKEFKPGISYRKGEPLVVVDANEYRLNLEAQKSAFLNILTGMMPDLKADYPDNYQQWLKYIQNYESGTSLPPLPRTKTESEKYFIMANQVYSTYFTIKAQEERLNKYTIRAPFNGSLSITLVDEGGLINPGQPLGTFISDTHYEIEAGASLKLASNLKVGQRIALTSNELGKTFTATVVRINNIVDPNTQNIPVYLSLYDPALKPGMYLEGKVKIEGFANAAIINKDILTRDETVHVLEQKTIRKKEVKVLFSTTDSLVVAGLNEGDQLITKAFDRPVTGIKISE